MRQYDVPRVDAPECPQGGFSPARLSDPAEPVSADSPGELPGDPDMLDDVLPLVYDELRWIARRYLRGENPGHTLSTTALVHEAYLRLADQTRVQWRSQAHFHAVASLAMRRVLVDYARRRRTGKRGGAQQLVSLDDAEIAVTGRADALVALDEALVRLAALDERLSRVVECRFFGGLTEEETAAVLCVTARTVRRDWVKAKGWLYQELNTDV